MKLADEFEPFLYPNQYVWFTQSSKAAVYAKQLSDQASDDLNFVELVYNYVIGNITYDQTLADSAPTTEYIPDVDETFTSGRGICFDYAALMTAMLRSQTSRRNWLSVIPVRHTTRGSVCTWKNRAGGQCD